MFSLLAIAVLKRIREISDRQGKLEDNRDGVVSTKVYPRLIQVFFCSATNSVFLAATFKCPLFLSCMTLQTKIWWFCTYCHIFS